MTCPCGKTLGHRNKSGLCRSCSARKTATAIHADPECKARQIAGIARFLADPANRARVAERLNNRVQTPQERKKRREWGKHIRAVYCLTPDAEAKRQAKYAMVGKKLTAKRLAWCPPERRDEYLYLISNKHIPAKEARRIIEDSLPGTVEHARRSIANVTDAQRIREERRLAQSY